MRVTTVALALPRHRAAMQPNPLFPLALPPAVSSHPPLPHLQRPLAPAGAGGGTLLAARQPLGPAEPSINLSPIRQRQSKEPLEPELSLPQVPPARGAISAAVVASRLALRKTAKAAIAGVAEASA